MIEKKTIHELVLYLLFNENSARSCGLFNGKAGIAWSLFEAARYLKDERIENAAFSMFQEAMVRCVNDSGFEEGLAGIGFLLIYLIENKFIDGDFKELFGDKCTVVLGEFESVDKRPDKILHNAKIIYFLSALRKIGYRDERIPGIQEKLFQGLELFLSLQFHDWDHVNYVSSKTDVLASYASYLRMLLYSGYENFSPSLLKRYSELYRKARIACDYAIGCNLRGLMEKYGLDEYEDVAKDNIELGMDAIPPPVLYLDQKIDRYVTSRKCRDVCAQSLQRFNLTIPEDSLNQMRGEIRPGGQECGYQSGLARYLIYRLDENAPLL